MNYIFYAPEIVDLFNRNPDHEVGLTDMVLGALMGEDYDTLMEYWQFGPDHPLDRIGRMYATLIKQRIPDTPKELFVHWNIDEAIDLWGEDGATLYILDNASIMVSYNPDEKHADMMPLNIPHEIYPRGI